MWANPKTWWGNLHCLSTLPHSYFSPFLLSHWKPVMSVHQLAPVSYPTNPAYKDAADTTSCIRLWQKLLFLYWSKTNFNQDSSYDHQAMCVNTFFISVWTLFGAEGYIFLRGSFFTLSLIIYCFLVSLSVFCHILRAKRCRWWLQYMWHYKILFSYVDNKFI